MGTIVVGIDGSLTTQQALAWAAAEARLRGGTVMDGHGSQWEG